MWFFFSVVIIENSPPPLLLLSSLPSEQQGTFLCETRFKKEQSLAITQSVACEDRILVMTLATRFYVDELTRRK